MRIRHLPPISISILLLICGNGSPAQDSTRPTPAVSRIGKPQGHLETQVSLELLAGPEGVSFRAQKWVGLMEELNLPMRTRRGFGDEKNTGVVEKMVGTSLREVHIIGQIDSEGTILVGDRKFRISDEVKFREWIKELKTYGAQGTPQGKPIWGLSLKQFEDLFSALSEPVEESFVGKPLKLAIHDLKLPAKYPLLIDESARLVLDGNVEVGIETEVRGFAHGVALAILLKEQGLGFYPRRTPEGGVELGVADRAERDDVWPTGWPPQGDQFDLVPGLATLTDLHAVDQPLQDFMKRVEEQSQLPILYDLFAIHRDQIDLGTSVVNLPQRRMTWMTGLRTALFKNRLRTEILTDEAGRPYLWITSEKLKPLLPIPKE